MHNKTAHFRCVEWKNTERKNMQPKLRHKELQHAERNERQSQKKSIFSVSLSLLVCLSLFVCFSGFVVIQFFVSCILIRFSYIFCSFSECIFPLFLFGSLLSLFLFFFHKCVRSYFVFWANLLELEKRTKNTLFLYIFGHIAHFYATFT